MQQSQLKLITTSDGSHSLLREDLNETYHSFHGAKGESTYVFIEKGLEYLKIKQAESIKVFEVGLGTGLNALLTGLWSDQNSISIDYHTIEPIPVPKEISEQLNYAKDASEKNLLLHIHECPWHETCELATGFKITKYETTLESFDQANDFDIIFFDAFAPSKQPEVWQMDNIQKCYDLLKPSGVLVTYCAQGQFKRNLKAAGFEVEILPGAMGKKEMVRAVRPKLV